MKKETHTQQIGSIGNYYGGLNIKTEDGKFFWSIEDCSGFDWEEIPESLYTTLDGYEGENSKDRQIKKLKEQLRLLEGTSKKKDDDFVKIMDLWMNL